MNGWLRKQLEAAEPDLLREMVQTFAELLMAADADEACGAPHGVVFPDRVTRRNGYRTRRWDTRVGTINMRIQKLREGTYFPDLASRRSHHDGASLHPVCGRGLRAGGFHPAG